MFLPMSTARLCGVRTNPDRFLLISVPAVDIAFSILLVGNTTVPHACTRPWISPEHGVQNGVKYADATRAGMRPHRLVVASLYLVKANTGASSASIGSVGTVAFQGSQPSRAPSPVSRPQASRSPASFQAFIPSVWGSGSISLRTRPRL